MDRFSTVLAAFLVGLLVGVAATGYLVPAATAVGGADDAPPYAYSTATASDVEAVLAGPGGWLHEVSIDDIVAVTGNATVRHRADETVRLTVTRTAPGTYEFAFETVPATTTEKTGEGTVASTLTWGVSLPADYEAYRITVDGTEVRQVRNDGATTARLLDLPHPLA
jgi:hypothetical protein